MKTRLPLVALVGTALLLVGCSGSPQTESAPAAESPAPVEETSTVEQWASLIAQQKASWEDWETGWDDNSCSGIAAGTETGMICRIHLTSALYQSQTTSIEYELATGPGKKGFLAEQPPAEIASLFAATQEAASAAQDAGTAWDEADCSVTPAGNCGRLAVSFDRAIDDLLSQFDAWGPYL